jgi:hypothetical protein
VSVGRDFALTVMNRWGAAQRGDDMAVVVSELLTNALRHALPDVGQVPRTVRVRRSGCLEGLEGVAGDLVHAQDLQGDADAQGGGRVVGEGAQHAL